LAQTERRRLKRHVERLEAHFQSGRMRGHGHVRNLCKEGLFIRSDRLPEPGLAVSIVIETNAGDKVEVQGTVRWTTAQLPNARSAPSGFGVRLEGRPSMYRELFEALLLH